MAGYVLGLAIICILSFLPLGIRTFTLFEPAALAGFPIRRFLRSLRIVTNQGRRWLDPSFQNHARNIAERQLRLIEDLMALAITDDRSRNDTILSLTASFHLLSRKYLSQKAKIPSDSLWFPRKPQFARWQVMSSPSTSIALQTGTTPSPEFIPDHEFIEQRCIAMTLDCLRNLLKRGAVEEITTILLELSNTTDHYARMFEQEQTMQLVASVRTIIIEWLKEAQSSQRLFLCLQIIDILCVAAIAPVLSTSLSILERPLVELMGITSELLNLDTRGLYRGNHPRLILKDAEDLFKRLEFERLTEGQINTQPWYVQQIIAFAYAEFLRKIIANILLCVEREFVNPPSELIESRKARFAGAWLQRGLEACRKAEDQIQRLDNRYEELKAYHVTELEWHPSGGKAALKTIVAHRKKIIQSLAIIVPDLCEGPSEANLPDLLGQACARIADELVSMMEQKEEENFPELFAGYFNASSGVCREFINLAQQPEKADYIRATQDVMVDVLEVSGLALLFSELDGTHYRQIVESTWDFYLSNFEDQKGIVLLWLNSLESELNLPISSPSAMQRQKWGQGFAQALADRGVNREFEYYEPWSARERRKPHPSAIIESIHVSYGHPMTKASEYFAALYLARLDVVRGLKLPKVIKYCMQEIELAEERQKKASDEKETAPEQE